MSLIQRQSGHLHFPPLLQNALSTTNPHDNQHKIESNVSQTIILPVGRVERLAVGAENKEPASTARGLSVAVEPPGDSNQTHTMDTPRTASSAAGDNTRASSEDTATA